MTLARPCVLVVDDSHAIRREVSAALLHAGYGVCEAGDGIEGLSMLAARPDIVMVICDVHMPNMNGLEMLARFKEDPSNATLPVLMLTTDGRTDLIQEARRCGAKGWIVKPVKVDQLIAVVRKLALSPRGGDA